MKKDVNLTDTQLEMVRGIALFAEAFCNQVYHIMQNHGLDKIDGCLLRLYVDPTLELTARNITVGNPGSGFGYCNLARGKNENEYSLFGLNSCTYEELFGKQWRMITDPDVKEKLPTGNIPLPEDGFWY